MIVSRVEGVSAFYNVSATFEVRPHGRLNHGRTSGRAPRARSLFVLESEIYPTCATDPGPAGGFPLMKISIIKLVEVVFPAAPRCCSAVIPLRPSDLQQRDRQVEEKDEKVPRRSYVA